MSTDTKSPRMEWLYDHSDFDSTYDMNQFIIKKPDATIVVSIETIKRKNEDTGFKYETYRLWYKEYREVW